MITTHRKISEQQFDLVIIGAGINGAGIARDAAMRGLSVLLLDKDDIGGGTSSWSTRLIHGGLRYLEHGEIGLVRESLRERQILLRIAPHLVRPLPILIPIYDKARRGRRMIRAGMIAYDLLSFDKALPRHQMLSPEAASSSVPGLESEGLEGAALYWDAQAEFVERLVLENALAAKANGAEVLTYARVDELIVEQQSVRGVEFTDLIAEEKCSARGRLIVNASGPWVDEIVDGLGGERLIGGTKGSHIIVPPFPGAPNSAIYVEAKIDQRPFFIIPWNGSYLIGTTDIRFDGNLDHVTITDQEIDYLLAECNRVIPRAQLGREEIHFTYAGVRPLPFTDKKEEQAITRRHFIRDHAPGLNGFISIVGGKLTTYRSLAEQTVSFACKRLGLARQRCRTHQVPLPGAVTPSFKVFTEEFLEQSGLPISVGQRLLRIYGTRAPSLLKLISTSTSLARTLTKESDVLAAEVVFSFQDELAQTLTDSLFRRTMIGLSDAGGLDAAEAAAEIARTQLGWTAERAMNEVARYDEYRRRFTSITI